MQGFRDEMEKAAAEGGFVLKEWFKSGDDATIKMLGYTWNCKNDLLFIQANIVKGALDRGQKIGKTLTVKNVQDALSTSLLSIIAQIYDPLGLCAPVTNSLKVLFSRINIEMPQKEKLDNQVPLHFKEKVVSAIWQVLEAKLISFPRTVLPRYVDDPKPEVELVTCCDASTAAYTTALYICHERESGVEAHLLYVTTKVAGSRNLSVPWMELLAAELGVLAAEKIPCFGN